MPFSRPSDSSNFSFNRSPCSFLSPSKAFVIAFSSTVLLFYVTCIYFVSSFISVPIIDPNLLIPNLIIFSFSSSFFLFFRGCSLANHIAFILLATGGSVLNYLDIYLKVEMWLLYILRLLSSACFKSFPKIPSLNSCD